MAQRTHTFGARASYVAAGSRNGRGIGASAAASVTSDASFDQRSHDPGAACEVEYFPSDEECKLLAMPITELLSACKCYEMLGTSTQVVVLDVNLELAVAFIAAQERRLDACVLWEPNERIFCGVLSSTDYIEILLYCHDHPDEAERVPGYTIREWREKIRKYKVGDVEDPDEPAAEGFPQSFRKLCSFAPSALFITCSPETPVSECLEKIMSSNAKRIAVVVEKEAGDLNVAALLDLQQILSYLGAFFLSMESAGSGSHGGSADTMMMNLSPNSRAASEYADLAGASALEAVSGYRPFIDSVDASNSELMRGSVTLSLHVQNLQSSGVDDERDNPVDFSRHPRVGPYKAIVDVPFCFVPQLGQHRNTVISVTLETPLLEALRLLLLHNIECIAVTSENGVVIDAIGRSDIVRIEDQGVYDTKLTVRDALGDKSATKIRVFHEKDTLRDIFIHFVRQRVRELFLVDPNTDKLLGQLNISEVVFFLAFGTTNNNNPSKSKCGCGVDAMN